MKMNLDDPNLTAYALGELSGPARAEMESAVAKSAEARAFVQETRQIATLLETEFASELNHAERKPLNILPLPVPRSFWSDARWMSIGVAALLAICTVIAAVSLTTYRLRSDSRVAERIALPRPSAPSDVQMEIEPEPARPTEPQLLAQSDLGAATSSDQTTKSVAQYRAGIVARNNPSVASLAYRAEPTPAESFNTADYGHFEENPFLPADSNPLSTFSIDVDTASYANVRRMINAGTRPPKDAVRIEEMINYFAYDYPQPEGEQPFSIHLEVAGCPWTPEHRLVRVGLKGREVASDKRGASNLVFLLEIGRAHV